MTACRFVKQISRKCADCFGPVRIERHKQELTRRDRKNCSSPCPAKGSNPGSSDLNSDSLTTEPRPPVLATMSSASFDGPSCTGYTFFLSFCLRSSIGGVACATVFHFSATWAATFRLRGTGYTNKQITCGDWVGKFPHSEWYTSGVRLPRALLRQ